MVPGTRGIAPAARSRKNSSARCGDCDKAVRTASMPPRQVTMTANKAAAKLSGSHPPSAIFNRFAEKNAASTIRKNAATGIARAADHCQDRRMATYNRHVVNNIVVATAVPYAPARRSELPNAIVMPTVPAIMSQLTMGT